MREEITTMKTKTTIFTRRRLFQEMLGIRVARLTRRIDQIITLTIYLKNRIIQEMEDSIMMKKGLNNLTTNMVMGEQFMRKGINGQVPKEVGSINQFNRKIIITI